MTPVIPGWMAFAWRTLVLGAKKFVAIDGTQRGAAFAYYAIFSLFPLLVLFVSVGSAFVDREVAVKSVLEVRRTFRAAGTRDATQSPGNYQRDHPKPKTGELNRAGYIGLGIAPILHRAGPRHQSCMEYQDA